MPVKIKQRDSSDCGAACIASIAGHYKLHLPVARIRQYACTDQKGTTVLGLVEALEKLGFQAKGVRGASNSLSTIPTPCIAHVRLLAPAEHFVVIQGINRKSVRIMDPADGRFHTLPLSEFERNWTGVLVIMIPMETFKKSNLEFSTFRRFSFLLRPHVGELMQTVFGAALFTAIGLSMSIYVQKIVDYVLVDGNFNLLNLMSIGMIVLLVFQVFIGVVKNLISLDTGQRIDARLILGYYRHLLTLPQSFFDTMRVGEIISRFNDAVKIRAFINEGLSAIVVNAFVLLFAFLLMFTFYWKLATMALMIIPLYVLIYIITNSLNKKSERKLMEQSAELESQLVESLEYARTIKTFGLEIQAGLKTETKFVTLLSTIYTSGINSIFSGSTSDFIARFFTIVLLWVGAGFVLDNRLTPGGLLSFYALFAYFTGPVNSLIGINKTIQNALIAADRLFEIMDLESERGDRHTELPASPSGKIVFKDVTFRYGTRTSVIQGLNLEIDPCKVTAIVGESGSGKSTLMAILQGLYPLQSGQVMIGEYNLRYVTHSSLRRCLGVVPQRVDLFSGNVIENIVLSDHSPDMMRVNQICQQLGIRELLENLPNGYHTHLGENGASLSGGQRQRIAVARALYKDPAILILDEATSSMDSESEDYVLRAIEGMRNNGKTVVLISHKLRTVVRSDKIVVIEKGKVVEQGTHELLLGVKGTYHRYWNQQFQGVPTIAENGYAQN